MISVTIDPASLNNIREKFRKYPELLNKAAAGALNDTAKHERTFISSGIRERVNIKKADIDPHIKVGSASGKNLAATVTLRKTDRLSLKYFGATQTKNGVTYRIQRAQRDAGGGINKRQKPIRGVRGNTKDRLPHAFGPNISNKLQGHVFERAGPKVRLQNGRIGQHIYKKFGPSAWGVFVQSGMRKLVKKDAKDFLAKRIKQRLQYQT